MDAPDNLHDVQLSDHFSLGEFLRSETAQKHNIDMTPSENVCASLQALCVEVLEPLRARLSEHYGKDTPMIVTSGYRPVELNDLVGGVPGSQHLVGEAADIVVPGKPVIEISRLAAGSKLPYDQVIHEFGRWTHISYGRTKGPALQRRMAFTMYKDPHTRKVVDVKGIVPVPAG